MWLLYADSKATLGNSVPISSLGRLPPLFTFLEPSSFKFETLKFADSPFKAFLIDECGFSWTELTPFLQGLKPFFKYKPTDCSPQAVQLLRDFGFSKDQFRNTVKRHFEAIE